MPDEQLALEGAAIVVIGEFAPIMFSPEWFAARKLLKEQETKEAKVQIIHPDATIFKIDWGEIYVTRQRFQVTTTYQNSYSIIRDLIVGTFSLLDVVPLKALGINLDAHYTIESEKKWHRFGDLLVPKDIWNSIVNDPGMRSVIIQAKRPDDYEGHILVKVEPSVRFPQSVYFHINDEYRLSEKEIEKQSAFEITRVITKNFDNSLIRSREIIEHVLRQCSAE